MDQLKIGDMTLTWLNGGITHLDGGAMFGVVPKPLWSKKYAVNEKNQIPLRTDPILIETGEKRILIESGIGNGKLTEKQKRNFGVTEESKLQECLRDKQLHFADIDAILMTHMHFDHASGLTIENRSRFPNATIYCSAKEWEEMRHPTIRSKATYWENNWKGIEDQGVVFQNELEVFPGIRMVHTGGHSSGHSIVIIESKGEMVLHMADLMPTHAHKNPLWVMAYDDFPMDSIREKERWITFGTEHRAWFTFYHDAFYRAIQWGATSDKNDQGRRIHVSL
ncbi:YtnP family quorum-quenching lactonase [Fervidibacillus albus]|uniref:MBL fold metallo-hydrolase n=1 Tax=Fervidibacillus albus TaxID=2980026 RepID=A0A9E8LVI3_9BACI|nr:MBL fold metallo-hydrolase [Fervidibacillus albus]WAA10085.1 MBL fold metallo-hydrolase [Fervidibacillus albus]